jgi:O-methyltransferase domain/Dimerisation domain
MAAPTRPTPHVKEGEGAATNAPAIPAHLQLMQMATGCWISQLVSTAANLCIADHLAGGPKSASEIAPAVRCNPRTLHRFMRALANFGIVLSAGEQKFALTPLGEALKSGAPGAGRSTVLITAGPMVWKCFEQLQYSVETGKTAMEKSFGTPLFDYLAQHPELASQFSEAMVGIHGAEPAAVAAAYDFSALQVIVDVGGATGNMLAHILTRYPQCRGVLFDCPHVVADAPTLLRSRRVESRVRIEHGDFFKSVPEGGDAYILSHIIHDWSEEQCLTILSNCRKAMRPGSKLLLVEFVLPEGDEPHIGKLLDMTMLAVTGGEERTTTEYTTLLARAGLTMTRVIPTGSDVSIVEAELLNH